MGSPYPLHYTLRWPFYYMWPSIKNHTRIPLKPLEHHWQTNTDSLRLNFCGDIMITQKDTVPNLHPEVAAIINQSDYFLGNCEAPVGNHHLNLQAKYHLIFHMPEKFLSDIINQTTLTPDKWILSIANNHSGDKGAEAFFESLTILTKLGIKPVGHFFQPDLPLTIIEKKGLRIGIVSWTHWLNCHVFTKLAGANRYEQISAIDWPTIKKEQQIDILIGLPHWEYEFQHFPKKNTRYIAKHLIEDKGFNLLVGSHPHTLQPMEWFDNGLCLYSLGNFCGLGMAWPVRLISLLEVNLDLKNKGKIAGYKLHSVAQVNRKDRLDLVPLDQIDPQLKAKFLKRRALVFTG